MASIFRLSIYEMNLKYEKMYKMMKGIGLIDGMPFSENGWPVHSPILVIILQHAVYHYNR